MKADPVHVKFRNRQHPGAAFDIVRLEELTNRADLEQLPFQLHLVEFYMIILIEKGRGSHTIDFTNHSYREGTVLTIRKDQLHKFHSGTTSSGTLLLFTDEFLVSYLEKLEALKSLQLFNELLGAPKIELPPSDLVEIAGIIARIKEEYIDLNDDYSLGIIRSELHILITKLYRIKARRHLMVCDRKYLNEFINFQSLVEKRVTQYSKVKDYAGMIGVSTKTLNTITQTVIHKSAKAFIDDIYTKQIKRLLINTALPIKEVAYKAGFEETTNFYKYFKRQTDTTPEQFRMKTR